MLSPALTLPGPETSTEVTFAGSIAFLTVTTQALLVTPPAVRAVMLAMPSALAVTLPLPSTVATAGLSEFQVRASAAPAGSWAELMVPLAPGASSRLPGDRVTLVALMAAGFTRTVQVALTSPARAVMTASPGAMPVTRPPLTMATPSLLLVQVMESVAFAGSSSAVRFSLAPARISRLPGKTRMPVALIAAFVTVTLQVAVKPPSVVVTVMVAVPSAMPVTLPLLSTVAISPLLVDQLTALLKAFSGIMLGTRVSAWPMVRRSSAGRVTPVT